MPKYLDNDGLLYFWQKIKGAFAAKNEAIKNITRSGKTFTATRTDGTSFTFTQQDNDTWNANSKDVAGYVAAPTSSNTNKVWGTDGSGNPSWRDETGAVTGVKGNAESTYRTGNVNLTPANIGAAASSHSHAISDVTNLQTTLDGKAANADYQGSTVSEAGTHGLVPAAAANSGTKSLFGDGIWKGYTVRASRGANNALIIALDASYNSGDTPQSVNLGLVIVPEATTSGNGLMSIADKTKLDGVDTDANNYTHPSYTAHSTSQIYKFTNDASGHVNVATAANGTDIKNLLGTTAVNRAASDESGNNIADTYAKKTDIAGMYKYQGSVASESLLPTTGQTTGDVYNIETASSYGAAGANVAWNGTSWDSLGEIFTIASITNSEIDVIVAS